MGRQWSFNRIAEMRAIYKNAYDRYDEHKGGCFMPALPMLHWAVTVAFRSVIWVRKYCPHSSMQRRMDLTVSHRTRCLPLGLSEACLAAAAALPQQLLLRPAHSLQYLKEPALQGGGFHGYLADHLEFPSRSQIPFQALSCRRLPQSPQLHHRQRRLRSLMV